MEKEFFSLSQVKKLMAEIEKKNLPSYLVELRGSDSYEIRDFAVSEIKLLNEKEIADDALNLLELSKNENYFIRQEASDLLKKLPGALLGAYIPNLLILATIKEACETAEALLDNMSGQELVPYFNQMWDLLNKDGTIFRFHLLRRLLVKIMKSWSLKEKEKNQNFIQELQSSMINEFEEVGHQLYLDILGARPVQNLKDELHYLVKQTKCSNSKIAYTSAYLAYRFLSSEHASQVTRAAYLDYMFSFLNWGNDYLRHGFRTLALQTLKQELPIYILPYANFLITCFDGSILKERQLAFSLLKKVKPDDLPLNTLLRAQRSDLFRVKRLAERLTKRISSRKLAENLELLLKSQGSICGSERDLAARLIMRIPRQEIEKNRWLIEKYSHSENLFVRIMVSQLLATS